MAYHNEERDLLEQMVAERDYELKSLKSLTSSQENTIQKLNEELNKLKVENTLKEQKNKTELKEIQLSNDLLQKRLNASIDNKLLSNNEKVAMLKHNLQLGNCIINKNNNSNNKNNNIDVNVNGAIKTLQSNLTKTVRHLCTLEKQMEIIKDESSKHLKVLKYEINEVCERHSREEITLLNQLSILDREKTIIEDELRGKIGNQKDVIDKLHDDMDILKDKAKNIATIASPTSVLDTHHTFDDHHISNSHNRQGNTATTISEISDDEDGDDDDEQLVLSGPPMEAFKDSNSVILEQLASVSREKDCMEQDLRHELRMQRETITQLQSTRTKHQTIIEQLNEIIEQKDNKYQNVRCTIENELKDNIQFIMEGQQESLINLQRVDALHDKTSQSIVIIQELIEPFEDNLLSKQQSDDNNNEENVKDIITYYTTALLKTKLLFEEMKVSLSYVEIQLKFQQSSLQAISNNDTQNNHTQQQDNDNNNVLYLQTKVKNMQENILNSIRTLERTYKQKYIQLQDDFQKQYQASLHDMHTKQSIIHTNEQTITDLQTQLKSNKLMHEQKENNILLQNKIKAKEHIINSLNIELNECSVRYDVLKDEFKKIKQKVKLMEVDDMLSSLERDVTTINYSNSLPEE